MTRIARLTRAEIARAMKVAAAEPGWRLRITRDGDLIIEADPEARPGSRKAPVDFEREIRM